MRQKNAAVIVSLCLVLTGAVYFIIQAKYSTELQKKETALQALQEDCAALQAEISQLKTSLAGDTNESPAKMKILLDQIEALQKDNDRYIKLMSAAQGTQESGKAVSQPIEGTQNKESAAPTDHAPTASDRLQIAQLQEENQRLRNELEGLKAQLTQKVVAASAETSPLQEGAPVFRNAQLLSAYQDVLNSTSKVRTLDLLMSLSGYAAEQEMELIPIIQQAMAGGDPEVCRAALELLEPYQNAAILPLLEQGFSMTDEDTRLAALAPLAKLTDPKAADLMELAVNDASEDVRARAMEIVEQQAEDIQLISLEKGLASAYADTKSQALSQLELRGDKAVVDVVLSGLQSSNSEFRQEVNSVLQFLLDREFESYQEAVQWWQANKNRYDDDLIESEQAGQ